MKVKEEKYANRELRDRVESQLRWEPEVTSTDIGVAAEDGVVTLTGIVGNYTEKLAAERAAEKTFGVKGVANDLEVSPLFKITDTDIATTAVKALEMRVNVPKDRVKVIVKNGFIYLDGSVDWNFQKDAAAGAVAHLAGAKGVINNITIKQLVSNMGVHREIEKAFRRNAELDARRMSVTSHDSTVELWGNVRTLNEKHEAERAAWAAPGVDTVKNHLHVVP